MLKMGGNSALMLGFLEKNHSEILPHALNSSLMLSFLNLHPAIIMRFPADRLVYDVFALFGQRGGGSGLRNSCHDV